MEGRKYATPCNKGGDIVQGNCLGVWGDMSRGCRDFSENRMIMFLMVSSCLYVYNHVCSIVSEITKNRRKLSEYIGNRFGRAVRIAKNLKTVLSKNLTSVQTVFRLKLLQSAVLIKSDKNKFTCAQCANKERFKTQPRRSF